METLILIVTIVITISALYFLKVKHDDKKLSLKQLAKKTFPKNVIIEKHGTVMICEINHRNEPDELVFIRVEPHKKKSISKMGRRLKAEYPSIPTRRELKSDFYEHLK